MKNITMADVAKHAGVSKSTVSQFLNKRYEYMSERTRQRVEASVEELQYRPNTVARSLTQKSTFTVGVIVANILHSFSTHIIRAIENQLFEKGFHIIVCNADDEPEKEKDYIEMLMAKQVDGIIIFPTGRNMDLYMKMKKSGFPIIFMDRTLPDLGIETVLLDNERAAELAVTHFVESDYREIAIITTSIVRNISPRVERIQGYKRALEQHQLNVRDEYVITADVHEIPEALERLFKCEVPPKALLAGNDIVLMEILKYIKKHELRIPEDVAVIGVDDVPFASFYTPSITTISQPLVDMANLAVDRLMRQVIEKKPSEEQVYRLQPELIVRDSC